MLNWETEEKNQGSWNLFSFSDINDDFEKINFHDCSNQSTLDELEKI